MMSLRASMRALAALLLAAGFTASADTGDLPVATYEAHYEVEYKGRKVGVSEFSVSYDSEQERYRFESRTTARGLLKLVRPDPAVERSDFELRGHAVRPLEFHFEDGSRKGEDNVDIVFDWSRAAAVIDSESGRAELSVKPGVLDRGTMQVALMRDLEREEPPGPYLLADGDTLKTYRYTVGERTAIETRAGTYETIELTQERADSSRRTLLWVAPSLRYLPVRIEQYRGDELQTAFELEHVEGLEPN